MAGKYSRVARVASSVLSTTEEKAGKRDIRCTKEKAMFFILRISRRLVAFLVWLILATALRAAEGAGQRKPVFLYSRYFNAEGEQRYLPDGTFKDVLDRLRTDFDVRTHRERLSPTSSLSVPHNLIGVKVVLIANPGDKAVGTNRPPSHFSSADFHFLTEFVEKGGGLIIMGNQENHNLEIEDTNKLLAHFGIQFTNLYTDAKQLVVPKNTPIIGRLRWAYYTGNSLTIDSKHRAKPRALVVNDLAQKPIKGTRDQPGALLASAEPGHGRVVVVTDSGWITDSAFNGKGVGDVAIKDQDNWEIFRRLARWTAHLQPEAGVRH